MSPESFIATNIITFQLSVKSESLAFSKKNMRIVRLPARHFKMSAMRRACANMPLGSEAEGKRMSSMDRRTERRKPHPFEGILQKTIEKMSWEKETRHSFRVLSCVLFGSPCVKNPANLKRRKHATIPNCFSPGKATESMRRKAAPSSPEAESRKDAHFIS